IFGRALHGPVVHADAVVLNKARNAFITETEDQGKVKSVSGDQLAITEGAGNVTYKDVTLTIPSNATIMRNFAKASLSALKTGDFVHVSQSSDGTFVLASDASHRPGPGHFGFRRGPRDAARGAGGAEPPAALPPRAYPGDRPRLLEKQSKEDTPERERAGLRSDPAETSVRNRRRENTDPVAAA